MERPKIRIEGLVVFIVLGVLFVLFIKDASQDGFFTLPIFISFLVVGVIYVFLYADTAEEWYRYYLYNKEHKDNLKLAESRLKEDALSSLPKAYTEDGQIPVGVEDDYIIEGKPLTKEESLLDHSLRAIHRPVLNEEEITEENIRDKAIEFLIYLDPRYTKEDLDKIDSLQLMTLLEIQKEVIEHRYNIHTAI